MKRFIPLFFLTLFATITLFYLCWYTITIIVVNEYSFDYYIFFYGLKIVPNILFLLLVAKYLKIPESITNSTSALFFLSAEILLIYFTFHFLMSIPITEIISYWSYQAIITWCASFLLFSYYFGKRWNDKTLGLTLSFFAVHFAGFLYEIPIYHTMSGFSFFHITHPFIVSPSIISFVCLLISIKLFNFKIELKKTFYYALVFLTLFSSFYFFKQQLITWNLEIYKIITLNGWLPRIPSLLFLFSILQSIKQYENQKQENGERK